MIRVTQSALQSIPVETETRLLRRTSRSTHSASEGTDVRAIRNFERLERSQGRRADVEAADVDELLEEELEFEEDSEPNRGVVETLFDLLRQEHASASRENLERAWNRSGLTDASLQNMVLPPSPATARKWIAFFKKADSRFAAYWNADPTNPYRDQVRDRLKTLFQTLDPNLEISLTDRTLDAFIDPSVSLTWPEERIHQNIGGTWARGDAEDLLAKMNAAMQSGNWGEVSADINSRAPGTNWGAHHHNNDCRRVTSAIFLAAESDLHLFRRYMEMIPANVRHDMINTLLEDQGELREIHAGDQWDSQTTAEWIRWTLGERSDPPSAGSTSTDS